jgi:hypothetical protein
MRSGLHGEDGVGVDNYELEGLAGARLLLGHPVLGEIDVAEGLGGGRIGGRGDFGRGVVAGMRRRAAGLGEASEVRGGVTGGAVSGERKGMGEGQR